MLVASSDFSVPFFMCAPPSVLGGKVPTSDGRKPPNPSSLPTVDFSIDMIVKPHPNFSPCDFVRQL